MYRDFYGLKETPFGLTPDLRYIFKTESYLEVTSTIGYGVKNNKGLIVVTGEAGTGKTTTLRSAIQQFGEDVLPVYIFNPFLTAAEFLEQLSDGFHLALPKSTSKPDLLMALGRYLSMRHGQGLRTVLIIDEAHGLPSALLEETRLLLNFETNSEKLLQIVLCGQPELNETLNRQGLRQLKQRISLRCSIRPFNQLEVNKYVRFRLKTAGAARVDIFDDEALELIFAASEGIPRVINNICDNALLYGYAAGCDVVTRGVVDEVLEALEMRIPELSSSAV